MNVMPYHNALRFEEPAWNLSRLHVHSFLARRLIAWGLVSVAMVVYYSTTITLHNVLVARNGGRFTGTKITENGTIQ